MNTAQPIREKEDLEKMKEYYLSISPNERNYLLVILGLNTALRISDLLKLTWNEIYDLERERCLEHIQLTEQKTGKKTCIYVNQSICDALGRYYRKLREQKQQINAETYLFTHSNQNQAISRVQAYRIIRKAADYWGISGTICCHSLRKTFGYHAWQQGVSPALLVNIYNHSSYEVTKRYLGIEQDDRDHIFKTIHL